MFFSITLIIILSFILALRSLRDLSNKKEGARMVNRRKTTGTIVFFKDKTVHYSSKSPESSSL